MNRRAGASLGVLDPHQRETVATIERPVPVMREIAVP